MRTLGGREYLVRGGLHPAWVWESISFSHRRFCKVGGQGIFNLRRTLDTVIPGPQIPTPPGGVEQAGLRKAIATSR